MGGDCFPKDVQAVLGTAHEKGYQSEVIAAAEAVNKRQKRRLVDLNIRHYAMTSGAKISHFGSLPLCRGPMICESSPCRLLIETLL
jgi:UDPglucose 6-dehydrogenase